MIYKRIISIKKIISFLCILFVISIVLVYLFYSDIYYLFPKDKSYNTGLCFFYNVLNPNMHFWIPIIILILPSNVLLNDYYNEHLNRYDYFIKERVGFNRYVITNYFYSFINSFLLIITIYIYMLVFINLFLAPISFSYFDYVANTNTMINLFSQNTFFNLFLFILFSSIGFSIYCCLIYSIKNFFIQRYIFKILSVVIGVLLIVLPIIIASKLYNLFKFPFILNFFSFISLMSLLFPGIQGFALNIDFFSPIFLYFTSLILYIIVVIIITNRERKREFKYDS